MNSWTMFTNSDAFVPPAPASVGRAGAGGHRPELLIPICMGLSLIFLEHPARGCAS
jgi:hypothetical protein